MNASGGVPGCALIQRSNDIKNGQAVKTSCQLSYDNAKQYDNDGACHNKWNGGSCMAIYLGMAMEMPKQVGMVSVLRKVYGGCFEEGGFNAPAKVARYQKGQQRWKGESAYNPWTQHQS